MESEIGEFIPVELIIIYDSNDVPDHHYDLILSWLKNKFNYKGDLISDVWDFGLEIRIIHWEWHYNNEYYLIIDITGNPNDLEEGIICIQDKIIFENDKQKLSVMDKKSILASRLKSFEHVRQLKSDQHQHCNLVLELYEELLDDLEEESVDEDEFDEIINHPYVHVSEDDASDVDTDETETDEE